MLKKLLLILILIQGSLFLRASHIAGSDLTYRCLGGDTFEVTLNIFRDCSGVAAPATALVRATSTCGGSVNLNMQLQVNPFVMNGDSVFPNPANGALEVSQLCPRNLAQSKCKDRNNPYPGMEQYVFKGIMVLSPQCNKWDLVYTAPPARNSNRNLATGFPGVGRATVRAELYSQSFSCNNSPRFSAQPIPYVCSGQPVVYNFGVTEDEGDSLTYSFVCGFSNNLNNPNVFRAPYSCNEPIAGATIDSTNGKVRFTPTILGNFVLVVEVKEYDRATGQLKGSIMRDILFVVQTCTNQQPDPNGPIIDFSGQGAILDSNSIEICVGESFQFKVPITDPDTADTLSLISNIEKILPNSSFTYQSFGDSAVATISWSAVPTPGNFYSFYIEANDGACPVPGLFYSTYDITIVPSTFVGPDLSICQGTQTANINTFGGTQFNWTALPGGDPLVVGTNFDCDTCQNVVASPNLTTTYVVVTDLSSTCKNTDTITVTVAPNFNTSITAPDTVCELISKQLVVTPSDPNFVYSYNWSFGQFLSNDTIANPVITTLPVTTSFVATVSSAAGCTKRDTVKISVANPFPRNIQATVSDTLICLSDTVQLDVDLGGLSYNSCGTDIRPCQGYKDTIQVGSGAQSNGFSGTARPIPYGGAYNSVRQQFIYRRADLLAAGIVPGTISSLGFFIQDMGTASSDYDFYTIKMGCTSLDSATGVWQLGLTEVFSPKTVTVANGWNMHTLDVGYNWNGSSNLIIEICFDNSGQVPARTQSPRVRHSATSYPASQLVASISGSACNLLTTSFGSPMNFLPNIRFEQCQGLNPAGYTFNWEPTTNRGYIGSTTIKDPQASVNLSTANSFSVIVRDTLGVCIDTATVEVNVVSRYNTKPIVGDPICVTGGIDTVFASTPYDIVARPGGGFWSGPGIVSDSLGLFDPSITGVGSFTIKYEVRGDACASEDSSVFTVVGLPDPNFSEGLFCEADSLNIMDTNAIHIRGYFRSSVPGVVDSTTNNFNATAASINAPDTIPVTYVAFNGCFNDTTLPVIVVNQFDANILTQGPFCLNDDTVLLMAADSGGYWTGGGVIQGKPGLFLPRQAGIGLHLVRVDSTGFCGNRDSTAIEVVGLPSVSITNPGSFCDDGSGSGSTPVSVTGTPAGGVWGSEGTPPWMPFTTHALFTPSQVVQSLGFGSYALYYTVFDTIAPGKACGNTDTTLIRFSRTPGAPQSPGDYEFCLGESVDSLIGRADSSFSLLWFDNASANQLADTFATGSSVSYGTASSDLSLFVRQMDSLGCISAPTAFNVFMNPIPQATLVVEPNEGFIPATINFLNTSATSNPGINLVKYEWNIWQFGLDPVSEEYILFPNLSTNSLHQFNTENAELEFDGSSDALGAARYLAQLYIESDKGCWDTTNASFLLENFFELDVPNVFTPPAIGRPGDGINDRFLDERKMKGLEYLEGYIYNRWGQKIYEINYPYNPFWDGGMLEDGVYFYVIKAKAAVAGSKEQSYSGWVTLIREKE